MKIIPCQQRSLEWGVIRAGIPTASEMDELFTPKLEPRKGQMPETYLNKKLAEWWMGGPLPQWGTYDMDAGKILEEEAIPFATLEYGLQIETVGFITTDDGRCGCSPDGLIAPGGIEIKCPAIQTHIGYLRSYALPPDYAAQVHFSMFVTGAPWWRFMSYHRRIPPLMLMIDRDDEIQSRISEGIYMFLDRFEAAKKGLCELNGGPPRRYTPSPPAPQPEPVTDDLIP